MTAAPRIVRGDCWDTVCRVGRTFDRVYDVRDGFVYLLLNGTSALSRQLVPRTVEKPKICMLKTI